MSSAQARDGRTAPDEVFSLIGGELADRLRELELFSRLRVEGVLHGLSKSPLKGFSADFLQHRQYYPGDNLKYLDWRVYGKSERLFVREYEELTNTMVNVVLDVSGSMGHRGETLTKHEYGVRTAAVLLYLAMLHRDTFSLSLFRTDRVAFVPFGGGRTHLCRAYRALLGAGPEGGTDFAQGLQGSTAAVRRRGLTVVISDFMAEPDDIVRRLARLRFRGSDVIAMQVFDPSEADLDFNSVTRFHDPESAEVLVVEPQLVRREYREAFEEHLVAMRDACWRYGFEHLRLPVSTDVEAPLTAYLRKRMAGSR